MSRSPGLWGLHRGPLAQGGPVQHLPQRGLGRTPSRHPEHGGRCYTAPVVWDTAPDPTPPLTQNTTCKGQNLGNEGLGGGHKWPRAHHPVGLGIRSFCRDTDAERGHDVRVSNHQHHPELMPDSRNSVPCNVLQPQIVVPHGEGGGGLAGELSLPPLLLPTPPLLASSPQGTYGQDREAKSKFGEVQCLLAPGRHLPRSEE